MSKPTGKLIRVTPEGIGAVATSSVVQSTGTSTTDVMSQKAATSLFASASNFVSYESGGGEIRNPLTGTRLFLGFDGSAGLYSDVLKRTVWLVDSDGDKLFIDGPSGKANFYGDGNISGSMWGGYLSNYLTASFVKDIRLGSPTLLYKNNYTNVFECPAGNTLTAIDVGDEPTVTAECRPIQKLINGTWYTVSQL